MSFFDGSDSGQRAYTVRLRNELAADIQQRRAQLRAESAQVLDESQNLNPHAREALAQLQQVTDGAYDRILQSVDRQFGIKPEDLEDDSSA